MLIRQIITFFLPNLVASFASRKAIDLTHPVGENTVAWPTATKFSTANVIKTWVGVEPTYGAANVMPVFFLGIT